MHRAYLSMVVLIVIAMCLPRFLQAPLKHVDGRAFWALIGTTLNFL